MQQKELIYKHAKIHYRIGGKGTAVVLLHGFGEDGSVWDRQLPSLEEHYRLLVPDLPGSGQSDMLNGEAIGMEDYAEAIKAILDTEHIDQCHLLGHSMGGYIMLAFAEKYAAMLQSIGLVHSSAYADNDEKKAARQKSIGFIEKNGTGAFLATSIPGLFKDMGNPDTPQNDMALLLEKGKAFLPEALVQYYKAMIARPDRTTVLNKFAGPVLFVMGQYDTAVPMQQSLQQSYLPAKASIHILRNSGHMGMLEETERLNKILYGFLP